MKYTTIKQNGKHPITLCYSEIDGMIQYGVAVLSPLDRDDKHKGRAIAASRLVNARHGTNYDWELYHGADDRCRKLNDPYFSETINRFFKWGSMPVSLFFSNLKSLRGELCQN